MTPPSEIPTPHPSPNHSERPDGRGGCVGAIVIHTTEASTAESSLDWFGRAASKVSAHVVIDRIGTIWRVVPDELKAWHAGVSALNGVQNVNGFSLGVELVGHETQSDFPPLQIAACAAWCAAKCVEHQIDVANIVSHAQVALPAGRKVDPGAGFDFVAFRQRVQALIEGGA